MNQYALEKAKELFDAMGPIDRRNMKLYRPLMARAVVRAQDGYEDMSESNIFDITNALQEMCKQEGKK